MMRGNGIQALPSSHHAEGFCLGRFVSFQIRLQSHTSQSFSEGFAFEVSGAGIGLKSVVYHMKLRRLCLLRVYRCPAIALEWFSF